MRSAIKYFLGFASLVFLANCTSTPAGPTIVFDEYFYRDCLNNPNVRAAAESPAHLERLCREASFVEVPSGYASNYYYSGGPGYGYADPYYDGGYAFYHYRHPHYYPYFSGYYYSYLTHSFVRHHGFHRRHGKKRFHKPHFPHAVFDLHRRHGHGRHRGHGKEDRDHVAHRDRRIHDGNFHDRRERFNDIERPPRTLPTSPDGPDLGTAPRPPGMRDSPETDNEETGRQGAVTQPPRANRDRNRNRNERFFERRDGRFTGTSERDVEDLAEERTMGLRQRPPRRSNPQPDDTVQEADTPRARSASRPRHWREVFEDRPTGRRPAARQTEERSPDRRNSAADVEKPATTAKRPATGPRSVTIHRGASADERRANRAQRSAARDERRSRRQQRREEKAAVQSAPSVTESAGAPRPRDSARPGRRLGNADGEANNRGRRFRRHRSD